MIKVNFDPKTKPINNNQLHMELKRLKLPTFLGVMTMNRETDSEGKLVLGQENFKPIIVAPYISVKIGNVSSEQEQLVRDTISSHVANFSPSTRETAIIDAKERLKNIILPSGTLKDTLIVLNLQES